MGTGQGNGSDRRAWAAPGACQLVRVLVSVDEEPDAPTLEAEALQDYPPLVAFHEGCKLYRQGKITLTQLDELKDRAFKEVRETFCRTVKGDE